MFFIKRNLRIAFFLLFLFTQGFSQQASPPASNQTVSPVLMQDHRSGNSIKGNRDELAKKREVEKESVSENKMHSSNVLVNSEVVSANAQLQWLNTYQLKRNAFLTNDGKLSSAEKEELQKIIIESKSSINGTFTYAYMQLRESRNTSESKQFLEKAINIDPTNTLLLPEIAWQAERRKDNKARNNAIDAYVKQGGISALQLKFAEWIIAAAPSNALIVCHGENDIYPLWKADKANHIIVSLAMLEDLTWLNSTLSKWDKTIRFNEVPAEAQFLRKISESKQATYLLWTLRPELLKPIETKLFPIGPAIEYGNVSDDNLLKLKRFYFSESFKKYVLNEPWQNDIYAPIMANLIPGIKMLLSSSMITDSDRRVLKQLEEKILINSRSK